MITSLVGWTRPSNTTGRCVSVFVSCYLLMMTVFHLNLRLSLQTGVGAVVAFTNLSSTDKFLGDSSMPIINSSRPLVVLNDNFALPEVRIAPNDTDMVGCILNNAQVVPNTMVLKHSRRAVMDQCATKTLYCKMMFYPIAVRACRWIRAGK